MAEERKYEDPLRDAIWTVEREKEVRLTSSAVSLLINISLDR